MGLGTDPETPGHGTQLILRVLRVSLHLGFAALLLLGVVRYTLALPGTPGSPAWAPYAVYGAAALLAGVYLGGTAAEKRHALDAGRFDPVPYARAWLGVVVLLWAVLLLISADFVWLAFPLFFLQLHLLPRGWGLAAVVGTTVVLLLALGLHTAPGAWNAALVIGPSFGAAFAVVTALSYQALYREAEEQRRVAAALRAARSELAATQREAGVLSERTRLAREIHDTLAQGLSSIVLMSRAAERSLDAGDAAVARERLRVVEETASAALEQAREFVRSPGASASVTLPELLTALCEDTQRQAQAAGSDLQVRFGLSGDPRDLGPELVQDLLRASQASLANVLRHARARHAVLTLGFLEEELTLDVFDDGAGFDPSVPSPGAGLGLGLLRGRVEALGGSLVVESAPGEGTVVAIRVPERSGGANEMLVEGEEQP
ncbi:MULTISPECIES: histidine kinase [Arthrobacter]|uniref:Oxygen sensor histidine kinase NreB n=2 Tax=Arthrobacter TaxID=1663 RepID=A0ABU9KLT6_9MICC|nr:histidine kinase [Arthrobacter sp. YJM1]MDP5228199.1 histidine kinase [Arthrobacter sp. YJM1]